MLENYNHWILMAGPVRQMLPILEWRSNQTADTGIDCGLKNAGLPAMGGWKIFQMAYR
jgi:hypothetical protein